MYEFVINGKYYRVHWIGNQAGTEGYWVVTEYLDEDCENESGLQFTMALKADAGEGRIKAGIKRALSGKLPKEEEQRRRRLKRTRERVRWQNQNAPVDLRDVGINVAGFVYTLRPTHQKAFFGHVAEVIVDNGLEAARAYWPELKLV